MRWLSTPFRIVGRQYYYAPRPLRWFIIIVLVAGGIVGGASMYYFYGRHIMAVESSAGWLDYSAARDKGDMDGMKAGLDRAIRANPNDTLAARKRHDLEIEEADPDDTELAIVLVNHHMRANRLHEMYREASKVRLHFPKDWRSICIQAHYDWHNKGPAAARARLEELPSPEDPAARIDVGGLLYSLQLFENMGQDAAALRGLIVRRLLPILRGGGAATASPGVKINLVECYLEPFNDTANWEILSNYWSDASKLSDLALEAALDDQDVALSVRIGKLAPKMFAALQAIRTRKNANLSEEHFLLLRKQIEDRTRKAWTMVLEKEPTRVEAHLGLIDLAFATGDSKGVVDGINAGLNACGERTELLLPFALVGLKLNQTNPVMQRVLAAARNNPGDISKWLLAAKVAKDVKETRLAHEALETARKIDPKNPEVAILLADWHLEQGKPADAIGVLGAEAFKTRLQQDPQFVRRYAQTLTAMYTDPFDYLKQVDAAAVAARRQALPLLLAGLEGVYVAKPPRAERDAMVAKYANDLILKDPKSPQAVPARLLAAKAMERYAEYLTPPWPREAAAAALREFDQLPAEYKQSTQIRLSIAKLQLKGLKDPTLAAITAAPAIDAWRNGGLTPSELEIVGLILLAKKERHEALKVLEYAVQQPNAPAACWIALALARHALGQRDAARAALDYPHTKFYTLTPREHAEWTEASQTLTQESP